MLIKDGEYHELYAQDSIVHWIFGQIEVSEICEHEAILLVENDVFSISWFSKNIFDATF